jgi:hypothetical protein
MRELFRVIVEKKIFSPGKKVENIVTIFTSKISNENENHSDPHIFLPINF